MALKDKETLLEELERLRLCEEFHELEKEILREKCYEQKTATVPREKAQKPKILFLIDWPHWAFANIAKNITPYLMDEFDIIIKPLRFGPVQNYKHNTAYFLYAKKYDVDIVHFFFREHLFAIYKEDMYAYAKHLCMPLCEFKEKFIDPLILSSAVYDHLTLTEKECSERMPFFSDFLTGYYTCSGRLDKIYRSIKGFPPPDQICEDGVNIHLFSPQNTKRFMNFGRPPLKVGWVGNSAWTHKSKHTAEIAQDPKGVHTILHPALKILQQEGVNCVPIFADRAEKMIPREEMPNYYASIDVLVCTSEIEGTPNPVLEAMACGVPVISTDVGVVPDVFGEKQKQFILPERSPQALADKLKTLCRSPQLAVELSEENQQNIQMWDWSIKANNFRRYFWRLLTKRHPGRGRPAS